MIRRGVQAVVFPLAVSLSVAHGATYTWTDDQGTVHFTENPESVPKKLRQKVRTLEESGPPQEEKTAETPPPAKVPDATSKAAPVGGGDPAAPEVYAGKTFDQWVKEFSEQEAAMKGVRKRIEEITRLFSSATTREELEKLQAEHGQLVRQFNEMRARYEQQMEIARKAGMQITIQR